MSRKYARCADLERRTACKCPRCERLHFRFTLFTGAGWGKYYCETCRNTFKKQQRALREEIYGRETTQDSSMGNTLAMA